MATLFNLLKKYETIIPIIQRDYAQGREDAHATFVRKSLLNDMHDAIKGNNVLDLNFIYGRCDSATNTFYPVDGQQRLTTLFLVHWYLFKSNKQCLKVLKKFSYQARFTSKDFFENLINHSLELSSKNIVNEIKDSVWFEEVWMHDPTIKGVLNTLKDIEEIFSDIDEVGAKNLLDEEKCPITFVEEYMDDLGMSDSLYVKLNSRGRPLTNLELLKAKLFGYVTGKPEFEGFKKKFDGEWSALFWNKTKGQPEKFDNLFLNFLGILLTNHKILKTNNRDLITPQKYLTNYGEWINEFDSIADDDYVACCSKFLDYLCNEMSGYQDNVFEILLAEENDEEKDITYIDFVNMYALSQYAYSCSCINEKSLKEYLRVVHNLIYNSVGSERIDKPEKFKNALHSVAELANHKDDVLGYLLEKTGTFAGFGKYQCEEEQLKAKIIKDYPAAEEVLNLAEKHDYFDGQIGAGLYLSDFENKKDINLFTECWAKITKLIDFNNTNEGNTTQLLRRALLTYGDYSVEVSYYKTLCPDDRFQNKKTPSMKELFTNHGAEVKNLVNDINLNEEIETQLQRIVDNSIKDINLLDLRYLFIEEPLMFNDMTEMRLYHNKNKVFAVKQVLTSKSNQDVYLKYLSCKISKEIKSEITWGNDESEENMLIVNNECYFTNEGKYIKMKHGNNEEKFEINNGFDVKVIEKLKECLK